MIWIQWLVLGAIMLAIWVGVFTMLFNLWWRVPFVPTPRVVVDAMVRAAEIGSDARVYDLGAGDGRLVIAAARSAPGVRATGYEIAVGPWLLAQARVLLSGRRAEVAMRNFLAQDLSDADVVFAYLSPQWMTKIRPKLQRELKPGARVVSHAFTFRDRPADAVHEVAHRFSRRTTKVHVYVWGQNDREA